MSRKDYEAIAKAVGTSGAQDTFQLMINLCSYFKEDNSRFDSARFHKRAAEYQTGRRI